LRHYLKNKFNKLQWKDKVQIALDITHGLMCLHSKKIIHGDLVNKDFNIFRQNLVYADSYFNPLTLYHCKACT
jgi:hypothetical protein